MWNKRELEILGLEPRGISRTRSEIKKTFESQFLGPEKRDNQIWNQSLVNFKT